MSTESVLGHHLGAIMAGDVDAILEDFTEDSVLFTPDGPVRGLDALREMFTGLVTELLPPGSDLKLIDQSIEGEVGYVAWSGSSEKYDFPIGTDTFVVKNDKIVVQTFAAKIDPK
ncbi:MAG: nuclear transport factor 2 family protein [Chloroflexi bacterium]|jgi:ketosteroid isomerase-like protein|nr:nuclear transport factor 2 family protein [Chloroflexota bacterium]MBT4074934.1 nuclear transport factor 2 family protein [Chloroflexota bacterium]MBT4514746.1 nuclear transport factor 2 family protein [Chloroflexota bacterium]MBT5320122.1 nuclear transport factor 2 family protein [Chloroflexota bacterium]MBT6683095.1 nuclear transport factor 2 family protein [Chloroflexota bacterium]